MIFKKGKLGKILLTTLLSVSLVMPSSSFIFASTASSADSTVMSSAPKNNGNSKFERAKKKIEKAYKKFSKKPSIDTDNYNTVDFKNAYRDLLRQSKDNPIAKEYLDENPQYAKTMDFILQGAKVSDVGNNEFPFIPNKDEIVARYVAEYEASYGKDNDVLLGIIAREKEEFIKLRDEEKPVLGYIYLDVEKVALGQGYLLEPTKLPYYEGDTVAAALLRYFSKNNMDFSLTGSMGSDFYLSGLQDLNPAPITLPLYIKEQLTQDEIRKSDYNPNKRSRPDFLKEFDFSQPAGWVVKINNIHIDHSIGAEPIKDGIVVRLGFTVFGLGKDNWPGYPVGDEAYDKLYIAPDLNKDQLVREVADFNLLPNRNELLKNKDIYSAYRNLINLGLRKDITQSDIEDNLGTLNKAVEQNKSKAIIKAKSVSIGTSNSRNSVQVQDNIQLIAYTQPNNTNEPVIWSVDNGQVANVNDDGLLTGIKEGTVKVTATCGDASSSIDIDVVKRTPIVVSIEDQVHNKVLLAPTEIPIFENITQRTLFRSGFPPYVRIDAPMSGRVSAVTVNGEKISNGKDGKWKIVSDSKVNAYVPGNVVRLIYSKDEDSLEKEKTDLTKVLGSFSHDQRLEKLGKPIFEQGVNALLLNDKEAIKESYNIADHYVNQKNPTSSMTFHPNTATVNIGEKIKVTPLIDPYDTTDTLTFDSENNKIATVDKDGNVYGKSAGEVKIIATSGTKNAAIKVTVKAVMPEEIHLDETKNLKVGETTKIEASVTPSNANGEFVFTSKNPDIVEVSKKGVVRAKKEGEADVEVSFANISKLCHIKVSGTKDVEAGSVVFITSQGDKILPENNTITLDTLMKGKFVLTGREEDKALKFRCQRKVKVGKNDKTEVWITSDGNFNPYGVAELDATVYTEEKDSEKVVKNFKLKVEEANVTDIEVYLGDEKLTPKSLVQFEGDSKKTFVVKGRIGNNPELQVLPTQSYTVTTSLRFGWAEPNDSRTAMEFGINAIKGDEAVGKEIIFTVKMKDSDLETSFKGVTGKVHLTSFKVNVPETFEIDGWNGLGDQFSGFEPEMIFGPNEVSDKTFTWKSLTPDIGDYYVMFNNGIVPKKAGRCIIEFIPNDNPALKDTVSLNFVYKHPLKSVSGPEEITLKAGETKELDLTLNPENATETLMNWKFEGTGAVTIKENKFKEATDNVNNKLITSRKVTGIKQGTVIATGTPVDETAGAKPVTIKITVEKSDFVDNTDYLSLAKDGISYGVSNIENKKHDAYGNEWAIMGLTRSGQGLSEREAAKYADSIADKADNITVATDIARVSLALNSLGYDLTDVEGIDFAKKLYNHPKADKQGSNGAIWTLIALDANQTAIPEDAVNTREKLIKNILEYQTKDGSYSLVKGDSTGGVDMTAMAIQSLAPYYSASRSSLASQVSQETLAKVDESVTKAVEYLQKTMNPDATYFVEGGNNAASAAQVVLALTSIKVDPTKSPDFVIGANNLIKTLMSFKVDGGYAVLAGGGANDFGLFQVTQALDSFVRLREGQNFYFDMTDVNNPKVDDQLQPKKTAATAEVEKLTYLGEEDIKTYKKNIEDAKTVEAVEEVVKAAKADNENKKAAKELELANAKTQGQADIETLQYLDSTAKESYKTKVKDAETVDSIKTIVEEAKTKDAQSKAEAERQRAEALKAKKAEAKTEIGKLANLEETDKNDFLSKVEEAKEVSDVEQVLTKAKAKDKEIAEAKAEAERQKAEALKAKKAEAKQTIEALTNLEEGDKTPFLTKVEEATEISAIDPVVAEAKAKDAEIAKKKEEEKKKAEELKAKKAEAKTEIGKLANLEETDKNDFLSKVEGAKEISAVEQVLTNAKAKDKEVAEAKAEAERQKAEALKAKKAEAKQTIEALTNLEEGDKTPFLTKIEQATEISTIDPVVAEAKSKDAEIAKKKEEKKKAEELKAKKTAANEEVEKLTYLGEEDIKTYKKNIEDAKTVEAVDEVVKAAKADNENKKAAKELELANAKVQGQADIETLQYLDSTAKESYKTKVKDAETVDAIKTIVEEAKTKDAQAKAEAERQKAEALKAKKAEAKTEIGKLANLEETDKNDFLSKVEEAKEISAVEQVLTNAKAKDKEVAEAKAEAERQKAEALKAKKAEAKQTIEALTNLEEGDKTPFLTKVEEATEISAIDPIVAEAKAKDAEIAKKKEEEKKKAEALKAKKTAATAEIEKLTYLGEEDIKTYKKNIEDAKTVEAVEEVVKAAKADNENKKAAKELELANAKVQGQADIETLQYLDSTAKENYKTKVKDAETVDSIKTIVDEAKTKDAQAKAEAERQKAEAVKAKKAEAKQAIEALTNLEEGDKTLFLTKVEEATEISTIDPVVAEAKAKDAEIAKKKEEEKKKAEELKAKKAEAKTEIGKLANLEETDKNDFLSKVEEAKEVSAVEQVLANAKAKDKEIAEAKAEAERQKAEALKSKKAEAKQAIEALTNLEEGDKTPFLTKVEEATEISTIDPVVAEAKAKDAEIAKQKDEEEKAKIEVEKNSKENQLKEAKKKAAEEITKATNISAEDKRELIAKINEAEDLDNIAKIQEDSHSLFNSITVEGKEFFFKAEGNLPKGTTLQVEKVQSKNITKEEAISSVKNILSEDELGKVDLDHKGLMFEVNLVDEQGHKVEPTAENPVKLTFNLGSDNGNKTFVAVHKKDSGDIESWKKTSDNNGKITLTLTSLSPINFYPLLDEVNNNPSDEKENNEEPKKPEPADPGQQGGDKEEPTKPETVTPDPSQSQGTGSSEPEKTQPSQSGKVEGEQGEGNHSSKVEGTTDNKQPNSTTSSESGKQGCTVVNQGIKPAVKPTIPQIAEDNKKEENLVLKNSDKVSDNNKAEKKEKKADKGVKTGDTNEVALVGLLGFFTALFAVLLRRKTK